REFAGEHQYLCWSGTIGDALVAMLARPPSFAGKPPASPGKPGGIEVGPPTKTLLARLQRMALLDGGDATVAWLAQQDPAVVTEAEINQAGYALLELDHAREALALFVWNAERFPKSGNVHDSLGEGYWRVGDRARAVASYQRSLELDPKNDNAKR